MTVRHNEVRDSTTGFLLQTRDISGSVTVNQSTTPADRLAAAAARLAKDIRIFWSTEQQRRQIHDPRALRVEWRWAPESLTDHREVIFPPSDPAGNPPPTNGNLNHIGDLYRWLPTGRLVVLGRAGSGKTVLGVRLVLDLVANRDATMPVPVIASIGSWNPMRTDLRDWLAGQLIRDHAWLADGRAGAGTLAADWSAKAGFCPSWTGSTRSPMACAPPRWRSCRMICRWCCPAVPRSSAPPWWKPVVCAGPR